MKTTPVTIEDLGASVIAVPPLARDADLSLNRRENQKIIRHLEAGGVTTLLYGGNANFYNVAVSEYRALLDMLADLAAPRTWVIPSVGPAFGPMLDQARILKDHTFPTAMILPATFGFTPAGVEIGVRKFVETAGIPAVLYIKADGFIEPNTVARLMDAGLLTWIKYATVRKNTADDDYLRRLTDAVDPARIVSGIGEQPAIIHLRDFGVGGFTSGCVCIAPHLSTAMLRAIQANDFDTAESIRATFKPLEDLRNAHSPIRVLHEAVRLAGIADTGPILPLLTNIESDKHTAIEAAAKALLAADVNATNAASFLTSDL